MTPLSEIATEQLIYEDVTQWSSEEYMAEQERCQEMLDLHEFDAHDPMDPSAIVHDEYIDRVNHIEEMRRMLHPLRRPYDDGPDDV